MQVLLGLQSVEAASAHLGMLARVLLTTARPNNGPHPIDEEGWGLLPRATLSLSDASTIVDLLLDLEKLCRSSTLLVVKLL